MTYRVAIRKNSTGEVRLYTSPVEWSPPEGDSDESPTQWLWTEGNYASDGNRETFFEDAEHLSFGPAHAAHPDPEFGLDTYEYAALYAELPDGTRIALDDPRLTGGQL
ncbi:hypothetical protein [Microvirga brassicacearum]|uniref:Uncharacterized protein n=1 Tax=Microvirga brassicacearum TaxID=2580413 RepID=A0A5N3PH49_9HYPH|nr:hypothetical protein [Microvirga brassicacearum]KAB0269039.1 hypothetical protein FEZ63_02720 [Microvirga brassicacearum]